MDPVIVDDACSGADLVGRIRAGDTKAEEELFNRHKRGISFILRQQGVSHDVADDIFQETVTTVIEKIRKGEVREANSLSAFICAVAKNLVVAHFRKSSRISSVSTAEMEIPSPADQHEQLLQKEEAQVVRRVISELKTDRDRQIIIRYCLGEEDKTKICEDLGLSSVHFSRVLHRALQRFKEAFELHCKSSDVRLAKQKKDPNN